MRCTVADTIKCTCSHCGAKYRLPVEAQGRSARCKRCGKRFEVPRQDNLEDTILSWLSAPAEEEEEVIAQPRVISMPDEEPSEEAEPATSGQQKRRGGIVRMKSESAEAQK